MKQSLCRCILKLDNSHQSLLIFEKLNLTENRIVLLKKLSIPAPLEFSRQELSLNPEITKRLLMVIFLNLKTF
jgi:hypothetical protein